MLTKFSIIVPIYNGQEYIDAFMGNVLSCNYSNYEIILVDDGSTDQSPFILEKYSSNTHVKIIHQKNTGIWAARNAGLEHSTGEYVVFSDQDDILFVSELAYVNELIIQNDSPDVICAESEWIDEDTHLPMGGNLLTGIAVNQMVYRDCIIKHLCLPMIDQLKKYSLEPYFTNTNSVWHCIFRKSFLQSNDIRFIRGISYDDDFFFKLACFSRAETAYLARKTIYRWYIRGTSRSHTEQYIDNYWEKADQALRYVLNEIMRYMVNQNILPLDDQEFKHISRDIYWKQIKVAIRNECLPINPFGRHIIIENLKKLDISKTDYRSTRGDSRLNKARFFLLKLHLFRLLYAFCKRYPVGWTRVL